MTSRYKEILDTIRRSERYQQNLDWGVPRPGHPEGTVRAHLEELEANLERIKHLLSEDTVDKLRLLVHTHDSLKGESEFGVPCSHPRNHASLAREFLALFVDDRDLHNIVQYHDEPFALWRQLQAKGEFDKTRWEVMINSIADIDLFALFFIVDGSTEGKDPAPRHWFLEELRKTFQLSPDVASVFQCLSGPRR